MTGTGESLERDGGERCPQVFVVDSQALGAAAPRQVPLRMETHHLTFIYLLLALVLLGLFIEAGFIYYLYNRPVESSENQKLEYRKAESSFQSDSKAANEIPLEKHLQAQNKPAAFLQGSHLASGQNGVLLWRSDSFPAFLRDLEYKNNSLYFHQNGFYYIFSKISHQENCQYFKHQVMRCSESYNNKPMELMESSRYLCSNPKTLNLGNSYLGGIFQMSKGDSVFVQVNNSSQVYGGPYENFFGTFMI